MNKELMEALDILEKEKEISKETLFEAIENSLLTACKNHFGISTVCESWMYLSSPLWSDPLTARQGTSTI